MILGQKLKCRDGSNMRHSTGSKQYETENLIEPGHLQPQSQDVACSFCECKFSDYSQGELIIQCILCKLWAQADWAGLENESYECVIIVKQSE